MFIKKREKTECRSLGIGWIKASSVSISCLVYARAALPGPLVIDGHLEEVAGQQAQFSSLKSQRGALEPSDLGTHPGTWAQTYGSGLRHHK